MTKATKDDVFDALDNKIDDWQERQIDALNELTFPSIDYDANLFKAMGWFNLATDYTGTLFPNSTVNQLAKQIKGGLTVPMFILGKVQTQLEDHYKELSKSHQRLLNAKFTTVRDKFVKQIEATADTFVDDGYASTIATQVFSHVKDRDFNDSQQIKAFLRRLIVHANLVETDMGILRKAIQPRFDGLMKKIKLLWLASHHTPTYSRKRLYVRNDRRDRYDHVTVGALRNKETQKILDQIIARAWGHSITLVESKGNVLVEPIPGKGLYGKPATYEVKSFKGIKIDLREAERRMYMGDRLGPIDDWDTRKNRSIP